MKHKKNNRIGKNVLIFLLVLTFISLVFAIDLSVKSFNNQNQSFNITWNEESNKTYYIEIPMYSYVKNISLEIEEVLTS